MNVESLSLDAILSINTLLIMLGTGVIVWVLRQVLPDRIQKSKVWKTALAILPVGIGAGLAVAPGIGPFSSNVHNLIIGAVAGSLSSNTYDLVRGMLGDRMRLLLGSKAARNDDQAEKEGNAGL